MLRRRIAWIAVLVLVALLIRPSSAPSPTPIEAAELWWGRDHRQVLAGFHNGECTDLTAHRRPDVVEEVDEHAYARWIVSGRRGLLRVNWAAKHWPVNAAKVGFREGHRPRPRALMVLQPGAYGAARPNGHIAWVVWVGPRGGFIVRQEHAPARGRVTTGRYSARVAARMEHDPRVVFIY